MTLIIFRSSGNSIFDKCILSDVTVTIVTILFLLNNYVVKSPRLCTYILSLLGVSFTHSFTYQFSYINMKFVHPSSFWIQLLTDWNMKKASEYRILTNINIRFSWEVQKRCKKPWKRCSWKAQGTSMYRPASYPHHVWVFNSISHTSRKYKPWSENKISSLSLFNNHRS